MLSSQKSTSRQTETGLANEATIKAKAIEVAINKLVDQKKKFEDSLTELQNAHFMFSGNGLGWSVLWWGSLLSSGYALLGWVAGLGVLDYKGYSNLSKKSENYRTALGELIESYQQYLSVGGKKDLVAKIADRIKEYVPDLEKWALETIELKEIPSTLAAPASSSWLGIFSSAQTSNPEQKEQEILRKAQELLNKNKEDQDEEANIPRKCGHHLRLWLYGKNDVPHKVALARDGVDQVSKLSGFAVGYAVDAYHSAQAAKLKK